MTDTPKAAVSPMAMAIAESAARQFFERKYIVEVENGLRLQKKIEELETEIERLQAMNEPDAPENEADENGE